MQTPQQLVALIENHIVTLDLFSKQPASLYKPVEYMLQLNGKRSRPLLTLLAFQAFSKQPVNQCLDAALALELFHNFTLIHDDIMDKAPTRRGKPTVHEVWDTNTAILSGDVLFAYTFELLVKNNPQHCQKLVPMYAAITMEVCEGQQLDMDLATASNVSIPAYLQMIEKKTAALLSACLSIGATLADANTAQIELLTNFGRKIGIAFQLQDDYLDVYADAEQFGKQTGGDIIENKKTYLWLRACEKANPDQLQALTNCLTMNDNLLKVQTVKDIYNQLDIANDTQQMINAYFDAAFESINTLLPNPGLEILIDFVKLMAQRQK